MSTAIALSLHKKPAKRISRSREHAGILKSGGGSVFPQAGYHVWCSSVVERDGSWWLFYSRWPVEAGFDGWATCSEIALAQGRSPWGPFQPLDQVILPSERSHPWERDVAHNPTVVADERGIIMAYMATRGPAPQDHASDATAGRSMSFAPVDANGLDIPALPVDETWWTHRNNQRIGVAIAPHPAGPWVTTREPVLDVRGAAWDSQLVSNPTIFRRPDGRWNMIYKAVTSGPQPFGGRVLHGIAEAADPQGPYERKEGVHPFAAANSPFPAEDPFAWYDKPANLYRAVVKDVDGSLTGQGRSLAFYQSEDGLHWEPSPLPPILGSKLLRGDGSLMACARVERPQITVDAEGRAVALHVACLPEPAGSVSFSLSVPIPPGFFEGGSMEDFYFFEP